MQYTLRQFLYDNGVKPTSIEAEVQRLKEVMAGRRPLTILSIPTREWARERGKI